MALGELRPDGGVLPQHEQPDDHQEEQLTLVMGGVFFLLGLGLVMAVNFLAAQAASTAAQRGLQIAQTPGQGQAEAQRVATELAGDSGVVTGSRFDISSTRIAVSVAVRVRTVLGATISRSATGPVLRFVPQQRQ